MARHVQETFIAASAPAVWEFTTDLHRVPEWVPFTREMLHVEGSGVGCRYTERGPLGRSTWTIRDVVGGTREVHEGTMGPARIALTNEVIPKDRGTIYRQTVKCVVFPRVRPLGWLLERTVVGWVIQSGLAKNGRNAKRILES